MDYDDSDFQSQTFQLVGEDGDKFPQSLQSFPLPKFDLDEHLHVHLRFDSLVETDDLLGIQGQGNNWIEDFAPVGSEIEFNSTAADSCSISRPKNVWSEATSSESVEMLLKSVGEDEMSEQKVIIREADADDGLYCTDSQTDSFLRQNDPNFKTVDIIHTDPPLPLDKCQKSLSVLCEDVDRDQFQIPINTDPSRNEKPGTNRDVSALIDKLNSEAGVTARQCSMVNDLTSSPDYSTKSSSVIKQVTCEAVQNADPLHNAYLNCAADFSMAHTVTGQVSDTITLRSTEDDLSSISTSKFIFIPGQMNARMFSKQAMEEDSKIEITEKSGSLADAAQEGSSQIGDNKVNEQPSQAPAVRTSLFSTESSSFLEPSVESLISLDGGCNVPEFPVNPGGLVGTVAYQVKTLIKDNQTTEAELPFKENYSLVMEGDASMEKSSDGIINQDEFSCLRDGCKSFENIDPPYLPKDDATHVGSTLSIKNINFVINYEGTELNSSEEVIEGKHVPNVKLADNNIGDDAGTPKFTAKVLSSNDTSYEIEGGPKQDGDKLASSSLTSQNCSSTVIAKHSADEVMEDIVKEPEIRLNTPNDRIEEPTLPALLDDAGKMLSSLHTRPLDNSDRGELIPDDPCNVSIFPPELAVDVQENAPILSLASTISKDDTYIILEKNEDASCETQKTAIPAGTNCLSAKKSILDESVVALAPVDVNLYSLGNSADVHQSQSEDTLLMDRVGEMKEAPATGLPASHNTRPDEKEVNVPESTILKSNPDAQISRESDDAVFMDHSLAEGMYQDGPEVFDMECRDKLQPSFVKHENALHLGGNLVANVSSLEGNVDSDSSQVFSQERETTPIISEVPDVGCQNELQSSIVTPEHNMQLVGNLVAYASSLEGNVHSNSSGAFSQEETLHITSVECSGDGDRREMQIEKPSCGDVGNNSPDCVANIGPDDECDGQNGIAQKKVECAQDGERQEMQIDKPTCGDIVNKSPDCVANIGPDDECDGQNGIEQRKENQCNDVSLSLSFVEVSRVGHPNELQSSIITHAHAMQLEGNLVAHASFLKENVDSDASGAFAQEAATLVTSGDDSIHCINSSPISKSSTRCEIKSHMLKSESANPSSTELDCGSPTVISCSGHSQEVVDQEGIGGRPDPADPIFDDLAFVSSDSKRVKNDDKSCSHDSKESTTSEEDRSFTFKVDSLANLSERDTGNKWEPFPNLQPFEPPESNLKMSKENSDESHIESEKEPYRTLTKSPDDNYTGHVSGRLTSERISISEEALLNKTPISKQSDERDRNSCGTLKSVEIAKKDAQKADMEHYPYSERNSKQSCPPVPGLNTSTSGALLLHQPFTDLQQVQLRAQIFVYGSLMQGIPPDEACMLSAFGETDGGRSLWEQAWRGFMERFQTQKSPISNYKTPYSHSGIRVSEQGTKSSSLHRKPPSLPSRTVSSAIANSTLTLPSPVWSVSTHDELHSNIPRVANLDFNQALSPLHSQQSSQIKQSIGNTAPWLSQSPRPGPWAISSQNLTLDWSSRDSKLPVSAVVQVTPARDSSVPQSRNMQTVSPTSLLATPGPTSVSTASVVHIDSRRKTPTSGNSKSLSSVQKSRKRKKGSAVHEETRPNILVSHLSVPASDTRVNNSQASASSGLAVSTSSPSKVDSVALVSAKSPIMSPAHYQISGRDVINQRVALSDETCSKVEQAKLQAEDASALAASAVRHSQGIWSQLALQKNSGLVSELDEKLASAAVAVAAAAYVTRAAAAAAKVASDAALQAKLMADEALNSVRIGSSSQISDTDPCHMGKSLAKLTPGSILTGKDNVHGSSSVICAAREAARRRVEAASAATKRAENLDAIVRAAELAAEAVSQAGTIIAMGEPLPFTSSESVDAGPEGLWKVHQSATDKLSKANNIHQEENVGLDGANNCGSVEKLDEQPPKNKHGQNPTDEAGTIFWNEHPVQSEQHYKGNVLNNASTFATDRNEKDHSGSKDKGNNICKGCLVEVKVDEDGLRGVWFSAHVLDVKDGKAYICYDNLVSDEGTGLLKEWVSLKSDGDKAPRIRLAHQMTAAKCEGTRKRRREAIGNYIWAVGDRVDAWIRDGWWEGIVTEKSQGDDTKLTIHFPDGGDSSTVRVWDLRPSLVWKDGHWIESPRAIHPYEINTPKEKRQKLATPEASIDSEVGVKGENMLSKNFPSEDLRKPEESRSPLILSAKDRTFSVGKNAREDTNSDALKVRRTGLQKEGSRVVFGIPKPGKKRKFMEVSKHYIEGKMDKTIKGNDSIKVEKYLMPQTSRIWRNTSKVDPKGKGASVSNPKELKSVKSRTIQTRSTAEKDNSSIVTSSNGGDSRHGSLPNNRSALSNSRNKKGPDAGSYANPGLTNNPDVEPSGQPVPVLNSSKKKSSPAVDADLGIKGKLTPTVDKATRSRDGSEDTGKTSDGPEPRRSSRRIQPTSRLLEGLQSSLVISKIPSFSHDRGTKSRHRGSSSRGNAHA